MHDFRIVADGDSALTVEFEERIDPEINRRVLGVADAVGASAIDGVLDVVPAFRSLTVYYDPLRVDPEKLAGRLAAQGRASAAAEERPYRVVRVPVCYGGEFGPDLDAIASQAALSPADVIRIHAAGLYRVFMIGFLPGFAYLAPVDPRIVAPRRGVPRVSVPAGSVGIAGVQTGVYPLESPGGWQLIGRTPLKPFDPARRVPCLFAPGDSVQFYAIEASDFWRADAGAARG